MASRATTDPIEILLEMGVDLDNLSEEEDYLSALMEGVNTLTIKDNAGNVLATVTTNRNDITNINGQNFTDRLIYTGVGSNIGNINILGSDANAPANLGGTYIIVASAAV